MKKIIILVFVGLLIFGCLGQPGMPPAQNTTQNLSNISLQNSTPEKDIIPAKIDLAGLTFYNLSSLEIPIECNISGSDVDMNIRILSSMTMGTGTITIDEVPQINDFIVNSQGTYMKLDASMRKGPASACLWLFEKKSDAEPIFTPLTIFEAPDLVYECSQGEFGPEAFASPKDACDFDSLLSIVYGGANICDSIDEATRRTACNSECGKIVDVLERANCAITFY